MTREHGMTFRPDMEAAIRSGRKTQTRRLMDPQPIFTSDGGAWYPPLDVERGKNLHYGNEDHFRRGVVIDFCPWQVGDRIFVKEDYKLFGHQEEKGAVKVMYRDGEVREVDCYPVFEFHAIGSHLPWTFAKFMPKWAARTWLEITEIKVQRIREISEADIIAEGCPKEYLLGLNWFRPLWQSLYPGSWERNEWVWVLTSKLIEGKGGEK